MTPKQPATAAGRELLRWVTHGPGGYNAANHDYWLDRILAIEAEAAAPDVDVLAQDLVRIGSDPDVPIKYRRVAKEWVARLMRERQP